MSSKADLSRLLAKRNHKILDLIAERDAARAMAERLARLVETLHRFTFVERWAAKGFDDEAESLENRCKSELTFYRAQTEQDRPK